MSSYRWELPLASAELNNTGYIHGNAKPHLFDTETGWSNCNKYWQEPLFAEEVEYTGEAKYYCKKCLKKYTKIIEEVE